MYLMHVFEDKNKPTLKISRLTLYSDMMAFGFENSSPYVEKIDKVLQTLIEAGLQSSWKSRRIYSKIKDRKGSREKRKVDADSSDRIVVQFTAMLLVFHSIAVVVFFVELLTMRIGPWLGRILIAT